MRNKIEAHAAYTGGVESLQCVVAHVCIDDGDAPVSPVAARDRIKHRGVVGAVTACLNDHAAREAQMVVQGNQRFERRVGGRVAAIVRVRELLGGAEYVAVGIARERGQRMRGFDRIRIWRKTGLHGLFGLH